MLEIIIEPQENWDEVSQRFVHIKGYTLKLEHSLVSLSKWEQKWHKPFLNDEPKTQEETIDYIRCMTINSNVPDYVYNYLGRDNMNKIQEYIQDPATATWFNTNHQDGQSKSRMSKNGQIITNEIVYYWMVELGIPVEFEKWHFNHLMTLIQVINIKHEEQDPNKKHKMSRNDILRQNAKLNAQRRKALNSKG